ncbi:MAG: ATP-binding cassette domain-containing protein [Chloroflexi bacterium]|nr:ATP-binding cassette domain-containing protein [Chloroflexota bacterium]
MTLYTLENVRHDYAGRTVLDLPQLDIPHGDILALVGPSGAGKSTLLRLLALLEAPTAGRLSLSLDGRVVDFHTATIQERRRLAMVFQRPVLLSASVRDNTAYGLRLRGQRDRARRVDEMLARLSLAHLANARPRTLSGGEMQRVAIARALILEPDVLLLDEPTANLDPYNVQLIEQFILDEHRRYTPTVVVVTHNLFQARRLATRVALLLDGELVETAPPAAFFDHPRDSRTQAFLSGKLVY